MRTGAIFARGSCRALKWMALVGMVFALGAGSAAAQVTVAVTDKVNEGATVTLTVGGTVTIDAGASAGTLTVTAAATAGTASADGTVSAGDTEDFGSASTASIATPANAGTADVSHTVSGTFTWVVGTDLDAEDEAVVLTYTVTPPSGVSDAGTPATKNVTIEDSHRQMFEWGPVPTLEEGGTATITLTAVPVPVQLTHNAALSVEGAGYTITAPTSASHAFTSSAPSVSIGIAAPSDDDNEVEDTITLRALRAGTVTNLADPLSIKVTDKTPAKEEDYVKPKSDDDIDAAVAAARARVDDSSGKWMVGAGDIMIALDDLFTLPEDASMFTITAEAGQVDDDVVMATASAAGNSVSVMAVGSGTTMVTVTVSANMNPSSANGTGTQISRNSASVMFDVTVDAPDPREPRVESTEAVITAFDIVGAEERRIGGVERLHIGEGTRTDVSVTVEWSVGQLRELYDVDSTPDPVVVQLGWITGDTSPDWLSPADGNGHPSEDFGDDYWNISIEIPRLPAATKKDWERVAANGKTPFNIHEDTDAEDEGFELIVSTIRTRGVSLDTSDSKTRTGQVVIDDNETQGIEIERTTKGDIYESGGGDQEFEVSADPALVQLSLEIDFDLEKADGSVPRAYGVSPSSDVISAGQNAMVSIDIDENDGDREDDDLVLHARIDSRNRSMDVEDDSYEFKVLDVHKLPTVEVSKMNPATGTVEEGGTIELTVKINRNPHNTPVRNTETLEYTQEEVTIMLTGGAGSTAGSSDYSITPNPVTFPERKSGSYTMEKTVEVMATADDELDDMEMLVLDAMVAGADTDNGTKKDSHASVASLTIEEGTAKLVWAKTLEEVEAAVMAAKKEGMGDDMMFTAGEMIELEGNDLFGSAEGVTVGYTAMVEGDAVSESVSGGVVTITAESMGMAKVTITARASRPSGAVMINDSTDPREASITVTLDVGLVALSIMLEGPEDMNLVEGGMGGMVTATANRAVTENTVVNLMRDRAMSSADDGDFTAEPITIMAGQMSGSTMVMAVPDDMMENDGNMAEELVLYGMAADNAGEVTGNVKFYLWDAAVPALPVIAQLLLAAFLAVGGYRRYLRR